MTIRERAEQLRKNIKSAIKFADNYEQEIDTLAEQFGRDLVEAAAGVAESISSMDIGLTGDQASGGVAMRREIAHAIRQQLLGQEP